MTSTRLSRHGSKPGTSPGGARGFTLVELTLGIVILGLAILFTVGPLVRTFGVIVATSEVRDLLDEGATALGRIAAEVGDAESVKVTGNSTKLTLEKAHTASDGYEEVVFFVKKSVLYRRGKPGGDDMILAQNVDSFTVAIDDDESLVTLEIQMVNTDGDTFSMKTKARSLNLEDATSKSFYNDDNSSGDWQLIIDSG